MIFYPNTPLDEVQFSPTVQLYRPDMPYEFHSAGSIYAAYGYRRLLSSWTGNILRLRRSSDSVQQDFGYLGEGYLDVPGIAAFLGANNGLLVTLYDQSGNGHDMTQATTTTQALYSPTGFNARPCCHFDGIDDNIGSTAFAVTAAYSFMCAYLQEAPGGTTQPNIFNHAAGSIGWGYQPPNNLTRRLIHQGQFSATDAAMTAGVAEIAGVTHASGAAPVLFINGASQTLTGTTTGFGAGSGTINIGSTGGTSTNKGYWLEGIIASVQWSAAVRAEAERVANSYWNIF